MNIFDIAKQNQEKAWQVIKNTNIIQIWEEMPVQKLIW